MDDEDKSEKSNKGNSYLRFSGMAFQMLATILLGTYGGMKLDEYLESESKTYTAILAILSIFVAIYMVIKDVLKNK